MDKAVNVVVVGSFFVNREVVYSVRSLEYTICETIRQIECGKSPHLSGLSDNISVVAVGVTEEFKTVLVIVETYNIRAYLVCDYSFITARFKLYAGHSAPVDDLS
jgi:hypothetical protein